MPTIPSSIMVFRMDLWLSQSMYLATISPECMSEKNCDGKTPLDVAILFENQDAVAFLLGITNKMRLYTPKESDNDD